MARNPLIEAIDAARYDLETYARHERADRQNRLSQLLEQTLSRSQSRTTAERLLGAPFDDYREFKRARKQQEWARLPPKA